MTEFNKDVLGMFSKSFPTPPVQPKAAKKSEELIEPVVEVTEQENTQAAWLQPFERGLKKDKKKSKNTISPKKSADDDMTTDATDILDDVALKKDKTHEMDSIINNTLADPDPIQKKQLPKYIKMQQKKRTVFIGNLPFATTEKEIKKLFKDAGTIDSIRFRSIPFVATDKFVSYREHRTEEDLVKGLGTKTCYVVYKDINSVEKALKLNNTMVGNKHIHVDVEKKSKSKDVSYCVFVGNIPFNVEDEQIREHFSQFGEIDYVRVIRDRTTRKTKGFCYVNFVNKRGYTLALSRSDQTTLEDRLLRITVAKDDAVDTRKNGNIVKPDGTVKRDYKANNNAANPYIKSNMNQVLEKRQKDKKPRDKRKPRDQTGSRRASRLGTDEEELKQLRTEKKEKNDKRDMSKEDIQKKEKQELKRKRANLEKKFKRSPSSTPNKTKNSGGKKPPKKKSRSA
jgi:nucleolar protein 12